MEHTEQLHSHQALRHTKQKILGVWFDLISYKSVSQTIEHWRQTCKKQYIVLAPPYSVLLSGCDTEMNVAMDRAGLVLPDGVGIILAANILNYENNGRTSGPTLMLKICDWGRKYGYRHYFYGGAKGVANRLADKLSKMYPGLQVAGTYSPPFKPLSKKEDRIIVEKINATYPDIVWVGLGTRKQEMWMAKHLGKIKATAMMGVGQAFDIHSGMIKWAPFRIRRVGLEWAYRLAKEPKRLWRRNLETPIFAYKVICQRLRTPSHSLSFRSRIQAGENIHAHRYTAKKPTSGHNIFSIDVEDWFHILNSPAVPRIEHWGSLEPRVERNIDRILELLHNHGVHATFFWLGWLAEKHKSLLRRCCEVGHEIASHSYSHLLPNEVGPELFKDDIDRAKKTLEDIIGKQVTGFRVAGFGIKKSTRWAFDVIKEVGYEYDTSVFPATREYGDVFTTASEPHMIYTEFGPLVEIPLSAVEVLGLRLFFFGGGYLRLSPKWIVRWGIKKLHKAGHPLIVYAHPREIDPDVPRLPLSLKRRFRCYVNLKSMMPKLRWLCDNYNFVTMRELVAEFTDMNSTTG